MTDTSTPAWLPKVSEFLRSIVIGRSIRSASEFLRPFGSKRAKALKIFTAVYHSSHSLNECKGIIVPFHVQDVKIDSLHQFGINNVELDLAGLAGSAKKRQASSLSY